MTERWSRWYREDPLSASSSLANDAFQKSIVLVRQHLQHEPKREQLLISMNATQLTDVVAVVDLAQQRYAADRTKSKVWTCLTNFSERINHYGGVLDVMVQHHPEYVSLAWGAMKLVFGAVVEHETLVSTIADALSQIGDSLPKVQLLNVLYPTVSMQNAIAIFYAQIMLFLTRALEWLEEGKLKRALHSITRPAKLHYSDILVQIQNATRSIQEYAAAASQAEQRDMHDKILLIEKQVSSTLPGLSNGQQDVLDKLDVLQMLIHDLQNRASLSNHHVGMSAQMIPRVTPQRPSHQHVLAILSSNCVFDQALLLQSSRDMTDPSSLSSNAACAPFWLSPKLQLWQHTSSTRTIILKSTLRDRSHVQRFAIHVIQALRDASMPVLWILRPPDKTCSALDILRDLLQQLWKQTHLDPDSPVLSTLVQRILEARTEDQYLDVLTILLRRFSLVFLVIEAAVLDAREFKTLRVYLKTITQNAMDGNTQSTLKLLIFHAGPAAMASLQPRDDDLFLDIRTVARKKRKAKPDTPFRMSGRPVPIRTRAHTKRGRVTG